MNRVALWIVTAIWFVLCSVLIVWLGANTTKAFDPELRLNQAMMDTEFESGLKNALSKFTARLPSVDTPNGYIFHIGQGSCFCESLAKNHQQSLDAWGKEYGFITSTIRVEEIDPNNRFIPSTPAVIAVDKNRNLIYMGPYSRGKGCFSTTGMVDEQLTQWISSQHYLEPENKFRSLHSVIETEAEGCYCQV